MVLFVVPNGAFVRILLNVIISVFLILLLMYHSIRLYYNKKEISNFKHNPTQCCCLEVAAASFLCAFPTLISNILFMVLVTEFAEISSSLCYPVLQCFWILYGLHKFGLHIYAVLQSQLHRQRIKKIPKIFYVLCMITPLNDIAFIAYVFFGHFEATKIPAQSPLKHCSLYQISITTFLWYGVSDIIIRAYALLLFLLPFQDANNNQEIITCISRMKLWTILSILISMTTTFLCYFIVGTNSILYPINQSFNVFSIFIQFKPISYKNIQSNALYYSILIIHCDIWKFSKYKKPIACKTNNVNMDNNKNNKKINQVNKNKGNNSDGNDNNIDKNNENHCNNDVIDDNHENECLSIIINNMLFQEETTFSEWNNDKNNTNDENGTNNDNHGDSNNNNHNCNDNNNNTNNNSSNLITNNSSNLITNNTNNLNTNDDNGNENNNNNHLLASSQQNSTIPL